MTRRTRPGLTLVELLVVIALITVLATLTVVYVVPAFSDNKNVLRGVDRTIAALLTARMRAFRDQAPRGIRFEVDTATGQVSNLIFVEQPDPYRTGSVTIDPITPAPAPPLPQGRATFTGSNLLGSAVSGDVESYSVQPGDWLVAGTNNHFEIHSVTAANQALLHRAPGTSLTNSYFKIIRQPRPIAGEESVKLPHNVVINLGYIATNYPTVQVPSRTNTGVAIYEIIFNPAGGVINQPSGAPIVLWVQDATAADATYNTTRLIAIYPRTGLIAAHPLGPSTGLLQFALDGQSSGM